MVLGDKHIQEYFFGEGKTINSASVDLAIKNNVILVDFQGYKNMSKIVTQGQDENPYSMMFVDAAQYDPVIRHTALDLDLFPEGIWLRPGVAALITTESVKMPFDNVGQLVLKSSRGREIYQACVSGFVDNGFEGELTMAIYPPIVPIKLQTGLKIVQMVVHELTENSFSYATQKDAKYQGQVGPTGSKA